jgi:molybdenum cofactor biosynthesis protein B
MGHQEHRAKAPKAVRVAVLSVSSTRTLTEDESGHWIAEQARSQGHTVVAHQVVPDDIGAIRQAVSEMIDDAAPQAVIVTGGTGISPKDVTIEALQPRFAKELSGFGALFAQLSYNDVKAAAIISRATAGIIGGAIIFCLPGSLKACQLSCNALIFPELGHLVGHAFRE